MNTPAAPSQSDGVLQVQHFVIDDVLHCAAWHASVVKDTAHDNRVMGGIVVSQAVAGVLAAPGHLRAGEKSVKKPGIQVVEYGFQVIGVALRRHDSLASAYLPDQVRLSRHVLSGNVATVPGGMLPIDRFPVHLG